MEFSRPEYWSGSRSLLQGIFPTQGSKPGLPHCRRILYHLSHQRSYNFLAGCWWVPSFRALIWIPITFSYLLNSLVQQTLSTFYISKIPSVIPSRLGSVQFSHSVLSDSLWSREPQHARPPCPSPTPGVHPNSRASSQWCHPAISSSDESPSPPAPNPSHHQGLFRWVNSSHDVAKVLELQPQHQSFQWTPRTDLL